MRIKLGTGLFIINLLIINLLALLLVLVIIFSLSNILRVILGLPFVLFFPGYTLLIALFPKKESLRSFERLALSFGISIAIVPLIGLILNFTPWGIRLVSVLVSVALFTFMMSVIGWIRTKRRTDEKSGITFKLKLPDWGRNIWDRVLSIVLIIAIAGALGTLGYAIMTPKVGERFTEFYLLGLEENALGYPKQLIAGEEAKVIVGIVNREQMAMDYRVEVNIEGEPNNIIYPGTLGHDEKWEDIVVFTPKQIGNAQKVEFILYKNSEDNPYLSLHIWVDVKEQS